MTLKILAIICSSLLLNGCDQIQSIMGNSVKCNDETSKDLLLHTVKDQLNNATNNQIKQLIKNENVNLDMSKVRNTLNQIVLSAEDIRTNNSDTNSKKNYCVSRFSFNIPQQIIKDANISRELIGQNTIDQDATLSDLHFDQNALISELEYIIQPTDDGKKLYLTLENTESLIQFNADIVIDALLKNTRKNAVELAEQEATHKMKVEEEAQRDYQSLLISEAQQHLAAANQEINLVWNATTAEVRSQLLPEQRIWLKKRKLECEIESSKYDNPDVARINCETNMTRHRTSILRSQIFDLE